MARTSTQPTSAGPVLFRLPNPSDWLPIVGDLPLLEFHQSLKDTADELRTQGQTEGRISGKQLRAYQEWLSCCDRLLVALAKSPRLTLDSVVSTDALVDVHELTDDERMALVNTLLDLGGMGRKDAEAVSPLVETTAP